MIHSAGYEYFVRKEWKKINSNPYITVVGEYKMKENNTYPSIGRKGRLG